MRAIGLGAALLAMAAAALAAQDLRGHGGPVGALAAAGGVVLSGAFDTRAILWNAADARGLRVLRLHDGNVTAVALLPGGGLATGGQDGRVGLWGPEGADPALVEAAHGAPVGALAVSPDGRMLASAGWDGTVRLAPLVGGPPLMLPAHQGKVTGLAFLPDGRLATTGADLRLRLWRDGRLDAATDLPAPPSALAVAGGAVVLGFADGSLRRYGPAGLEAEAQPSERPLVALAAGGETVAVSGIGGTVWLLDAASLAVRHVLSPGQGPIWSLALDGLQLYTGGADGVIRLWDAATGLPRGPGGAGLPGPLDDGSRGAEVWRACALCHTLSPDDGHRAGPSLHGVFGRRIGTATGYPYSEALLGLDIVWTAETIAALFEFGPEAYTPGSRMPEQRLPDPADRAALVDFLARHGG